jgi:predicted GNAT family acetyltransferase
MQTIDRAMTANLAETDIDVVQRLTLTVDGRNVAVIEFYLFGKVATVTHTEVDLLHQGKGLGLIIAGQALEHFGNEDREVVPVCGFFLKHLRRHPEYADLLTPHCRRIFAV